MNEMMKLCPTVPDSRSGTAGQAPTPSGTARGTAAGQPDLKALAHKVLRAGQGAGQQRDSDPGTASKVCPTGRDSGTASGTAANVLHKPGDLAEQRRRLTAAAVAQGIPAEIVLALDDLDIDGCQWLDEPGLRRYAQIVQENYLRAHGAIPLRPVRRDTPQSVTCATCAHQQRRADTSDAGMHCCTKGHGMHFANEQHPCADWRPAAKLKVSVAPAPAPALQFTTSQEPNP